jgi:HK97 family phage prohead protease
MDLLIVRDRSKFIAEQQKAAAASRRKKSAQKDADEFALVRRWDAFLDLSAKDVKKAKEIKDESGRIIDYADIVIDGYLSTFASVTPSDRDGDVVEAGAFKDTIDQFMTNPVLLTDHVNMVGYLAGSFRSVKEDRNGLKILADVTNSPDMQHVRFKIAEGHLKALSMGGIFYYREDKRTIFKVALWEGSLVTIPANQDALFRVRSLNDQEKKFLKSAGQYRDFYDFLRATRLQNQSGVGA